MIRRRHRTCLTLTALGGVCAALLVAMPDAAQAGGFLDFLFGGVQSQPAPTPQMTSYAEPPRAVAPVPLGRETVRQATGAGRTVVFCVRLCDGENFPMDHFPNATPVETCRALCPASRTKVFYGSVVDSAVARDGQRYADLENAFVYRKHLVANCTCNGRQAFGLAPFRLASDPTLRPGDIVVTEKGLMAYNGRRGQTASYTPVNPAGISAELNSVTSPQRVARATETNPAPVLVVESRDAAPRYLPPMVDLRGQVER